MATFNITVPCASYNVTIYSKAGGAVSGDSYNLYYSQDNITYNSIAGGPFSSTTCTSKATVSTNSGNIYIIAQRAFDNSTILIRGDNSATCPNNGASPAGTVCTYSAVITGNESVAITAWFDSTTSDYSNCSITPL